jgi:hypothetical protein
MSDYLSQQGQIMLLCFKRHSGHISRIVENLVLPEILSFSSLYTLLHTEQTLGIVLNSSACPIFEVLSIFSPYLMMIIKNNAVKNST